MPPRPQAPADSADLLWYHQSKREHKYLHDRIEKHEARTTNEIDELKSRLKASEARCDTSQRALDGLRDKVARDYNELRETRERNRELSERVAEAERMNAEMKQQMSSLGDGLKTVNGHAVGLERRLSRREDHDLRVDIEMPALHRRIEDLERVRDSQQQQQHQQQRQDRPRRLLQHDVQGQEQHNPSSQDPTEGEPSVRGSPVAEDRINSPTRHSTQRNIPIHRGPTIDTRLPHAGCGSRNDVGQEPSGASRDDSSSPERARKLHDRWLRREAALEREKQEEKEKRAEIARGKRRRVED